ncbi:MAG: hypothetical protein WDZ45_02185 [Flavobacteriaceae bacterium]
MTRFFYITFFTLVGFIMTPTVTYACSSKSNETEISSNNSNKESLQKNDSCNKEKGQCGEHEKDCDGKCGNSNCHCPSSSISFTIPFFAQLSQTKIILSKPKFYYQETYYSSGFTSIWLPPKIS